MIEYKESAEINGHFVRNDSKTGYSEKTETHVLSGSAPYVVELEEKISAGSVPVATIDAVPVNFVPYVTAPGTAELALDRKRGFLKYNAADATKTLSITYIPAGSVITAAKLEVMLSTGVADHTHEIEDVNGLQAALDAAGTAEHTHPISEVDGLQTALDGKAATSHTHAQTDITNLVTDLAGKASSTHSHAIADVTNLQTSLDGIDTEILNLQTAVDAHDTEIDGKAPLAHTHVIADTSGLQGALDAKAASSHTHDDRYFTETETNTLLSGKANTSHTHAIADVTSLQSSLDAKANLSGAAFTGAITSTSSITGSLVAVNGSASTGLISFEGSTFSLSDDLAGTTNITMGGTCTAGTFSGSGASLTSLPAGQLTGSIADALLSANIPKMSSGHLTITGDFAANTVECAGVITPSINLGSGFTYGTIYLESGVVTCWEGWKGPGSGLTNLNASNISSGSLADARLSSNIPLKNAANTFTSSVAVSNSGSTEASPTSLSIGGGLAARFNWFDLGHAIQISSGKRLQWYGYHGIEIRGGRSSTTPPTFATGGSGDPSLSVINESISARVVLSVDGTSGQTGNLQSWRKGGSTVASVDANGNFLGVTGTFNGNRITLTNATRNTIHFGTAGVSAPTAATGLKIKLNGSTTDNTLTAGDYGIGVETGNIYHVTGTGYKWYAGGSLSTVGMSLQGSNLAVTGGVTAGAQAALGGVAYGCREVYSSGTAITVSKDTDHYLLLGVQGNFSVNLPALSSCPLGTTFIIDITAPNGAYTVTLTTPSGSEYIASKTSFAQTYALNGGYAGTVQIFKYDPIAWRLLLI